MVHSLRRDVKSGVEVRASTLPGLTRDETRRMTGRAAFAYVIALCAGSMAQAQNGGVPGGARFGGISGCPDPPPTKKIPYDGGVTFVRLKYKGGPGPGYYRGEPSWAHGYGYAENGSAEMNLMKIVGEISMMRPHVDATNVIAIDDPALFRYPVAFLVEAGYVTLSDKEVLALRRYLLRGGVLLIDDTRDGAFPGQSGRAHKGGVLAVALPCPHPRSRG